MRLALYSLGVNGALAGLKLGLALLSGSLALRADGLHSLVDSVSSLVVLSGLFVSKVRAKGFPYGLHKAENLAALVLSVLILLGGVAIAREALFTPAHPLAEGPLAIAGATLAGLVAYLFSRYEARMARATRSPGLRADSEHFRLDVAASATVGVSVLGQALGLPLDRVGGGLVALVVFWTGGTLAVEALKVLLDGSLDDETLRRVRSILASNPGVDEVRSVVGRSAGRYGFVEAELRLGTCDLAEAHAVVEGLTMEVQQQVPSVARLFVHYEPSPGCRRPPRSPEPTRNPEPQRGGAWAGRRGHAFGRGSGCRG